MASREEPREDARPRLLVVSHPAVVGVNQEVYRELRRRGWDVTIVVPSRWRHSSRSYCRTGSGWPAWGMLAVSGPSNTSTGRR